MAGFGNVRELFSKYASIDPSKYDPLIKHLGLAKDDLRDKELTKAATVQEDVSEWQGTASKAFQDNVLAPLPATVAAQIGLTNELIVAAASSREIAVQAQKDVVLILLGTEAALENLDGGECDKTALTKMFGIFGAVAAAITGIGAILSAIGAASAAAAISVGNAGFGLVNATGLAANNYKTASVEGSIKGKTPSEVIESAKTALTKLDEGIDFEENKLRKALEEDIGKLDELDMEIPEIDLPMENFRP